MNVLGLAWENVVIGLTSAGFVGLTLAGRRRVTDWLLERRYPLAGRYLSHFDDEIEGKKTVVSAPVELTQRGSHVRGVTRLPGDLRTWHLDGQVSDGGHFHGVYYAEDPHDKGIGNFFLFIGGSRSMDGLWSGFDSANQKIASGGYHFMPVLDDLKIERLDERHIPAVLDVADEQLGKDYVQYDELVESTKNHASSIARFVSTGGKVVGFCTGTVVNTEDLPGLLRLSADRMPKVLGYRGAVGLIKSVAVSDAMRGRGVGSALVNAMLGDFETLGTPAVCAIAWRSDKGLNIGGILTRADFRPILELPEYWREDSLENDYKCPVCGEPPCQCSGVLFVSVR